MASAMDAFNGISATDTMLTILSTMRVELGMFCLAAVTYLLISARQRVSQQVKCATETSEDDCQVSVSDEHPETPLKLSEPESGDSKVNSGAHTLSPSLLPLHTLTISAVLVLIVGVAAVCPWPQPLKDIHLMLREASGTGSRNATQLQSATNRKLASKMSSEALHASEDDLSSCDNAPPPQSAEPPDAAMLGKALKCHRRSIEAHAADPKKSRALHLWAVKRLAPSVEALLMLCGGLSKEIEALQVVRSNVKELQQHDPSVDAVALLAEHAVGLFQRLRDLQFPFREATAALDHVVRTLQVSPANVKGDARVGDALNELETLQTAAREVLLKTMREARVLAMVFQHIEPVREQPLECDSALLAGVEDLAIHSAREEEDANADTHWDLAMYWSIVSVAEGDTPCFRDSLSGKKSAKDELGFFVPGDIVEAERMLLFAEEQTFEDARPERSAQRALRLQEHANFLSWQHLDGAAEWRYRAAASLAAAQRQPRLAAHSLARLASMLSLRSRRRDALAAADEALTHSEEPLALYLRTSLRLTFGEFPTGSDVREAAKQLQTLAGQLPWSSLETERAALEADLALWDAVAEGDVSKCLWLGDVAKVLICLAGRFAY